jgi:DNA-directed RNA polymerase beta subunit
MLGKNESIRIQHAFQFLLPHQKKNKALYLVIMAKSMVSAIRDKRVTDKDCLSNIRIEMVADLMSSITLQLLKRLSNELRKRKSEWKSGASRMRKAP